MKHIFLILIFFTCSLLARENPFAPLPNAKDIGKTTSIKQTRAFFEEQNIKLPSSARVLKSVELHYQNLDGSIESKVVQIDKNIDWHDEMVLQKKGDAKKPMQNAFVPIQAMSEAPIQKINFLDTLHVKVSEKKLIINTQDVKKRDFLVTKPYKIVLDFAKDISFTTKTYNLDFKPFGKMIIGNHDRYYRVVIELDGQYLYNIKKIQDGFEITLK